MLDPCYELAMCLRYMRPVVGAADLGSGNMDVIRLTNLLLQMQERSREGLMISPLIDEALAICERTTVHSHVVRDPVSDYLPARISVHPEPVPDLAPLPMDPDVNAVHRAIERSARHMPTMWGDILT